MNAATAETRRRGIARELVWPTLFTLVVGAILIGLGIWQLHRLAWKETLLAEIAARADAPPAPLPGEAEWAGLKPLDYDYRHVSIGGRFAFADTARVFTPAGPQDAGPGYLLLTPLRLASGATVIVNRGFVPAELMAKLETAPQTTADAQLTGLMRPPQRRGPFTPPDKPEKGEYFTSDPAVIAAHFHLDRVAPFIVDADAAPGGASWPRGGTTERSLPNNHLSYALTWFGLAGGLLAVFVAFVVRKWQGKELPPAVRP